MNSGKQEESLRDSKEAPPEWEERINNELGIGSCISAPVREHSADAQNTTCPPREPLAGYIQSPTSLFLLS